MKKYPRKGKVQDNIFISQEVTEEAAAAFDEFRKRENTKKTPWLDIVLNKA